MDLEDLEKKDEENYKYISDDEYDLEELLSNDEVDENGEVKELFFDDI